MSSDPKDPEQPTQEWSISPQPTSLPARYEILGELGAGGMGIVYKARDRETGDLVALKLLKPAIAADPASMERFKNELRLARKITHKNVCRIYEFSRIDGTAYISMEFVDGENLHSILGRSGRLNLDQGLAVARQICAGLREAHLQGIVHRDLKPANIMIDQEGNAKVMDFGIARSIDTGATATGMVVGTPTYLAPEQAEGKPVDSRTDIYNLGLILYEMFTGKVTFTGDTPFAIALKQIHEKPAAPSTIDPTLPAHIENTILRCLQKDPALRFQSMQELEAALTAEPSLTQGTSPETGKRSLPRDMLRPLRRPLWISGAVGLLLLLLWFSFFRSTRNFEIPFKEFTLTNGMRVLLSEDHLAPTFSISTIYNVGSRDERPGQTGFAHLFEHLMFQGSSNVGKGEYMALAQTYGGGVNGSSLPDYTAYWGTLPANQLDLALFLEADRMRSLNITQANLDTERQVVLQERRQNYDNRAYGQTEIAITETAYDNFAYKHTPIGTVEDLTAAKLEDVTAFFKTYYAPNNVVLSLAGDFKTEEALAKVKRYFEDIPSRPLPLQPELAEGDQKGERRKTIEDPFVQSPRIDIVYKISRQKKEDDYGVNLVMALLGTGASSRLNQKLVKEKEVAASVTKLFDARRGPSLVGLSILVRPGKDLPAVEKLVYEEIDRLKTEPVADWEFDKGRLKVRSERWQQIQSTLFRALTLGRSSVVDGDPRLINTVDRFMENFTTEEVRRLTSTYLKDTNRTVITTLPRTGSGQGPVPPIIPEARSVSPAKVERLNRAPVSNEILRVNLPQVQEALLENGLTVLVMEDHRAPLVWLQLYIGGAGSLYDPDAQSGLAGVTAQMLNEGTKSRTSQQIAEAIDQIGARMNAPFTPGTTATVINASGLSTNFDRWFELLADILLNPVFPTDELNSLKQRLKVQFRQQAAAPSSLANQRFSRVVFGNHPAAVVSPSPESIDSITPEALVAWYRERYAPQNTILALAGDIDAGEIIRKLGTQLASWKKTAAKEILPMNPVPPSARTIHLVDRPNSVQTTLLVGSLAIDRRDPDYLPMVVLNGVIGSGPASRLWVRLREEKGFVYNVNSSFSALKYRGPWRVSADMRAEATGEALRELLDEIRRISDEKVPQEELEDAKRAAAARFALSLEQIPQMLNYAITRKINGFSADYWDSYPAKIMAVSAEEVQRVARKYIHPDLIQVVAVGDAQKIRGILEKFGPVELHDAGGIQPRAASPRDSKK